VIQRIITRSGASAESVGSYAAAHEALARLPRVGESGLAGGAIPGVGDQLAPFALGVGTGPPGAADIVVWRTATAHLLPRLLDGRRTGPVFLTDRRTRVELPPGDLDQASGRARLSYRRAAECFEQATEKLPGGPWELHQLRLAGRNPAIPLRDAGSHGLPVNARHPGSV
jgi:hypothetical protein